MTELLGDRLVDLRDSLRAHHPSLFRKKQIKSSQALDRLIPQRMMVATNLSSLPQAYFIEDRKPVNIKSLAAHTFPGLESLV
jgi:hypothetical protein